jgi:hypothetical protein
MSGRRAKQSDVKTLLAERGWKPFRFQGDVWREMAKGRSILDLPDARVPLRVEAS